MEGPRLGILGTILSVGLLLIIFIGLNSGEPTGYAILKSILTKTGDLYVSSNPKGANVYVDNVYKGIAPITISLSAGSHNVKVTKSGYNDYISTVTISAGETTNFYATLPLPQSKIETKTTSSAQGGDIPSPYPVERQQDIKRASNESPVYTATVPPQRPATAVTPSRHGIWYAPYTSHAIAGEENYFYISALNLGEPVKICWRFTGQYIGGEYSSDCSEPIDSFKPKSWRVIDRDCYGIDTRTNDQRVPCSGYITVYSDAATQPIIPAATFCVGDSNPACVSLHFTSKYDVIGND